MKGEIRKELLDTVSQLYEIMKNKNDEDIAKLKELSDKKIESVALYKDLDLISINVLIYSIFKTFRSIPQDQYDIFLKQLNLAKNGLKDNNLQRYNRSLKKLFEIVHQCNAQVKEHLDDVMHAARIKKGATLLQKGLSIGQAAGLMGLSNWDLQQYIGRTTVFEHDYHGLSPKIRLKTAFNIFNLK